jgi:hypothetical protein
MRLSLPLLAATACLIGGSAFAQTAAPMTERSGGPTATAGTSAQSNRPASDTTTSTTATTTYKSDAAPASADTRRSSNKMMMGPKMTPDPNTNRYGGPTSTAGSSDKSNATQGPAPNNPGQQ